VVGADEMPAATRREVAPLLWVVRPWLGWEDRAVDQSRSREALAAGVWDGIELRAEPALRTDHLVRVLSSLVQTQSVNPGIYEQAVGVRVAEWFDGTGAELHRVESLPGRYSLSAVLKGLASGPTLVLNGHMDTVPIDDPALWTVGPFGAEVRDGYLYGRGACDMKAGLTVAIAVAQFLSAHRDRMQGTLICQFAIGEECAEPGTLSLCQAGFVGEFGIVLEPTELKVATAARGLAFYTVRIMGRSIHASQAALGLNPNWKLPAVLDTLGEYHAEIARQAHPLLPPPSCTPTIIRSGIKENAVPDYCEITVDRRLLPGETVEGELAELQRRLARIKHTDPEFEFEITTPEYSFAPAEIPADSRFARQVCDTVAAITGQPTEMYGTPFACDVRNLINDAGIEAITFGPGNVAECHCADERVSLEQLTDAALSAARLAADLLF
jgi:succinyl-diaminopimelate desuccinylase